MKMKKAVLAVACAGALVVGSVAATMAYLTSSDAVTNTFTVGNVQITLDEADVKTDGTYESDHSARVKANDYKLIPGHTYIKDPTVTVVKGSENSYIRALVTVTSYDQLKGALTGKYVDDAGTVPYVVNEVVLLQYLVSGWDSSVWNYNDCVVSADGKTATYEFRYYETVDASTAAADIVLDDLFETITLPGFINNTTLATLDGLTVGVVAQAIQADGFANADAAWTAFSA